MNADRTIKLDNVTVHRAEDGTVTIAPRTGGGCLYIGLLITTAILALWGLVATINGVIQIFTGKVDSDYSMALFGLIMTMMFGGFAYYAYNKMRYGQKKESITVTPILNVVKMGGSTIPFSDIAEVSAVESPSIMLDGAVNLMFLLTLSDGNVLELGRVVVEKGGKSDQRKADILDILKQAIKRV